MVSSVLTHQDWMAQALDLAQYAESLGEVPVAALIVDQDHRCVAKAHNLTLKDSDATAHAEIMAIREAGRVLGTARLAGCQLYVTLEPCAMCAGAIVQARLSQVIFAAYDPKMGAVMHGIKLFDQAEVNHRPEVISGIAEERAKAQLKSFFLSRR